MPWTSMMEFLKSWFNYPGLEWKMALVAAGLAILFGIIWLLGYWPRIFKTIWFWPLLICSAAVTLLAITFIQIPLQYYVQLGFNKLGQSTVMDWFLLVSVPLVLVSGLVQEAAKSLPVAIWWWHSGRTLTPKMGLIIGAVTGAGFGIIEAVWDNGNVFANGWTTQLISQYGAFDGLYNFITRFLAVGFHIGASALVGYGLAKGKWWQYFLIASVFHSVLNYSTILATYYVYIHPVEWLKSIHIEAYIAVITAVVAVWALILRWRKDRQEPGMPSDSPLIPFAAAEPSTPGPIVSIDMRTPPGAE
jgi:RsiW-degrading membrane proteinase PrsW (M82 family)